MTEAVVVKSYQSGINLILNPDMDFEELLQQLSQKFTEAKTFFGSAKMALSMEGRDLTDAEQVRIVEAITKTTNIKVMCVVGKDAHTQNYYIKALKQVEKEYPAEDITGQFFKGDLPAGQVLETKCSVVLVGNVQKGATVISTGNIIVLGSLLGEAYAGSEGDIRSTVSATLMNPERIQIADIRLTDEKALKKAFKKQIPVTATVSREKVVLVPFTNESLSGF